MSPWCLLVWLKQGILLSEVSPVLLFKGVNVNNIWPIQRDVPDYHYLLTPTSRHPNILPFMPAMSPKQPLSGGSSSCVDLLSRKRMPRAL